MAKGLGAAADRASQAREVFSERGKASCHVPGGRRSTGSVDRCMNDVFPPVFFFPFGKKLVSEMVVLKFGELRALLGIFEWLVKTLSNSADSGVDQTEKLGKTALQVATAMAKDGCSSVWVIRSFDRHHTGLQSHAVTGWLSENKRTACDLLMTCLGRGVQSIQNDLTCFAGMIDLEMD